VFSQKHNFFFFIDPKMAISLESSIRTCKIDAGFANKIFSDRYLNPQNMVCPMWNGFDTVGRHVCSDSYDTKTSGCQSAMERITVENYQRPQYIEYINLSAGGIRGDINEPHSFNQWDSMDRKNDLEKIHSFSSGFGQNIGAQVNVGCSSGAQYTRAIQREAQEARELSARLSAQNSENVKSFAGVF
jgi:hypothetical protein